MYESVKFCGRPNSVFNPEHNKGLFDASQKIAILQTLFDNIDEIDNVYDEEIDLAEFVVRDAILLV